LILISPFKRGGYDALKEVGIPLMPHLGYKEMTPLGQAEWIKFVGLLLGKEDKANEQFATIKKRYNELKELTGRVTKRPVVFSGELRGGNWYAVGGRSFLAQLFKDAGADYFLKDDERSGGVTLDFETVYSQAAGADYWRIVNSYQGKFSYNTLKEEDARYVDFKAYKEKGVIYCNMREKPFYESMPTEPEVVLADLIQIFHPQLLSGHQPGYYELLK
jgi:iron complex transport system substrate-binding protein